MKNTENPLHVGFEREAVEKACADTRLTAITASLFFPAFLVLDYVMFPGLLGPFVVIRATVVVLSLLVFAVMHLQIGARNSRFFAMFMYLLCGLSIVVMVHMSGGYASVYYAGINLVLLAFIFLLPLDAWRTALICAVLYGSYIVPILLLQRVEDFPLFLNNNFFLVATILVVILSAHLSTRMRYREFSARHSLAQANEELKKLDALKSQFFANVSHEVRTPLTSILAPIQTLYHGEVGPLNQAQSDLMSQMYRNALKLLDMINQMLDFSKYEAGKMQLRLQRADLAEVARDTVAIFREVAERKGVRLHFIPEEPTPAAFLDTDKIERILTNLVRNAIKFTDRGSITVRTGRRADDLLLEVRDTGIGIPATHLPDIFKRFQQVDASSTRKYEGTGLGLTIVKESVDLMKGSVTVESELGRGTSFRVTLPRHLERLAPDAFVERRVDDRRKGEGGFDGAERRQFSRRASDAARVTVDDLALVERELVMYGAEQSDEAAEEREPAGERGSLLLVEDNADLRQLIGRMLRRFGYRVSTAVDGLDGWEHTLNDRPDLLISDVMMPRMDGFELVRRIKTDARTKHIPVIMLTAKSEMESRLAGLGMGAVDYLSKPVNLRELDARIRALLEMRERQVAQAKAEELKIRIEELTRTFSRCLDMRDASTAQHSKDVLELGTIIAQELGLEAEDATLRDSLLLHDIGKQQIPDAILKKPAPLSNEEWAVMKQHPEIGAAALQDFPIKEVGEIVLAHQEHYDGTGYPRGLKGEQIPLFARIIATADAYHAMTNDRPYRKALPPAQAVAELIRHSGTQFDPQVVEAFLRGLQHRGWLSPAEATSLRAMGG